MEWQHKGGKVLNCKRVGLDGKLGGISSVWGGDGIPKELWLPHPWSVQGEAGAMWDSEGVPVHGVHTKPCRAPHTEGFDAFNNLFCSLKSFMFENTFPPPGPMFNIVLQNRLKHQQTPGTAQELPCTRWGANSAALCIQFKYPTHLFIPGVPGPSQSNYWRLHTPTPEPAGLKVITQLSPHRGKAQGSFSCKMFVEMIRISHF